MKPLTEEELRRIRLAGQLAGVGKKLCYLAFVLVALLLAAGLFIYFTTGG